MMASVAIGSRKRGRAAASEMAKALQEPEDIDPRAWRHFIARLKSYVARRVASGAGDDVVGDILLRLIQHRTKLAATRNPLAWVMRVAANVVTDHHRRRASEQLAMGTYSSEFLLYFDDEPSSDVSVSSELAGCVLPFIEQLPPRYRDALKLVEIDGLSQRAAADRLGLSVSGMKSRVQRGRKKLKEAILRCCAVELDRRGGVMAYCRHDIVRDIQCCLSDAGS